LGDILVVAHPAGSLISKPLLTQRTYNVLAKVLDGLLYLRRVFNAMADSTLKRQRQLLTMRG
jgi:hypothetical protein